MELDHNFANAALPLQKTAQCVPAQRERPSEVSAQHRKTSHYHRPMERPFLAEERDKVTILFGGFTWKHERLIEAILRASGYRCQRLPTPDLEAFTFGREYGNNGQCNPTYFTVGNLIKFLRSMEDKGSSRAEIIEKYVFFSAGSCGPCRFGMYESEYRLALQNAGYEQFRIILYQADQAFKAAADNPGLKFTLDFNLDALNMLNLGDVINDLSYRIRPFEAVPGSTDRAIADVVDQLSHFLEIHRRFEILERAPAWLAAPLRRTPRLTGFLNATGKILDHLYSADFVGQMHEARRRLDEVEVDHTRIKPVVKIVGEFWAQLTEGDGNFHMFSFLESEGAQVHVDSIGGWISYLLHQARISMEAKEGLDDPYPEARWWQPGKRLANAWKYGRKRSLLRLSEVLWSYLYARTVRHMGGITPCLLSQRELARLAHPFYDTQARGGEGHLEVGKNVYYTTQGLCHMVLALKPFGCMPSSQSDGVQSAVVNRFPEMIFLPVETAGEGEISAQSRVQMALGEARVKARAEFDAALASTGKSLAGIKEYVAMNRSLRSPFYPIPRRRGIAGRGANFVLHAGDLMDGRATLARMPGEPRKASQSFDRR
jgi:predicted nucleotide-binding protein (sugar kinase/HSP70/actin superfamily)